MKKGAKRRLNRLASEDVIAIPLLTATLALVLEYWVVEVAEIAAAVLQLLGIDKGAWSLVIFHGILVGVLYMNVVWDEIEEEVEEHTGEEIGKKVSEEPEDGAEAAEDGFVWGGSE